MSDELEDDWALVRPPPLIDPDVPLIDPDKLPNEATTPHGVIYTAEDPEHVGRIPTRQDTQLEGWTCHEMTQEEIDAENSPANLERLRVARQEPLDNGLAVASNRQVSFSMPVLQELWGRPWTRGAYNFLVALRPSAVRVSTGMVTADSVLWRVTVIVTESEDPSPRTTFLVEHISQEVAVGGEGFRNGTDAHNFFRSQYEALLLPQSSGIINARAIQRLNLEPDTPIVDDFDHSFDSLLD